MKWRQEFVLAIRCCFSAQPAACCGRQLLLRWFVPGGFLALFNSPHEGVQLGGAARRCTQAAFLAAALARRAAPGSWARMKTKERRERPMAPCASWAPPSTGRLAGWRRRSASAACATSLQGGQEGGPEGRVAVSSSLGWAHLQLGSPLPDGYLQLASGPFY